MKIVRRYSDIEELTSEILHEFIDKIVVHHREKIYGETIQQVEIYYKMIGHGTNFQHDPPEKQSYIKTFGRKKEEQIA